MSDRAFEREVHDWLEDGSDHTSPAAIQAVLLAIKTTRQQRILWVPRRFSLMPTYARYAAAVAIIAIAGVAIFAFSSVPGVGSPTPAPPSASPAPTPVASGIGAWARYTSEVYGARIPYPSDWSQFQAATRPWQDADVFSADAETMPFAEVFVSPGEGDATVALFIWELPAEGATDLASWEGLEAWVEMFCGEIGASSCDTFVDATTPLCNTDGGRSCEAAIMIETAGLQFAIFRPWSDAMLSLPTVRIVAVGRNDDHPSVLRYGGSVQLLRSILDEMGVKAPKPGQTPD